VRSNAVPGQELPRYLFMSTGSAYHQTVLDPVAGLRQYTAAYSREIDGNQWLLSRAASEQQQRWILPEGTVAPHFYGVCCSIVKGASKRRKLPLSRLLNPGSVAARLPLGTTPFNRGQNTTV